MLPDIDGEEVCKRIRSISQVYIFMLTAKGDLSNRVEGLNIGADEYLINHLVLENLRLELMHCSEELEMKIHLNCLLIMEN